MNKGIRRAVSSVGLAAMLMTSFAWAAQDTAQTTQEQVQPAETTPATRNGKATVQLEVGTPDKDGLFTVQIRVYNASFNVAQFVLWYDENTVIPADRQGKLANNFEDFAVPADSQWMSTIGTSVDNALDLIDMTGYVMPGKSVAVDGLEAEPGVAKAGESGLSLFTLQFKKLGEAQPILKLAAQGQTKNYKEYVPEGGMLANGQAFPFTLEITYPQEVGQSTSTEVVPSSGGTAGTSDTMTREKRIAQTMILVIDNPAAVVEGVRKPIYADEPSVAPYLDNGRTFVPVRFLSEQMNARVEWDNATETVTISKNGRVVKMQVGSSTYTIDGQTRQMDVPAMYKNEPGKYRRTMVPLRFVSEALGMDVQWDADNRAVIVSPSDQPWDATREVEQRLMQDSLLLLSPLLANLS